MDILETFLFLLVTILIIMTINQQMDKPEVYHLTVVDIDTKHRRITVLVNDKLTTIRPNNVKTMTDKWMLDLVPGDEFCCLAKNKHWFSPIDLVECK